MSKSEKDDKLGKPKGLLASYQDLLDKYPVIVNTIQGIVLTALSVVVSLNIQASKSGKNDIDYTEVYVMSLINAVFITPVLMWFYKNVLDKMPGGKLRKLVIDQFAFSPPFTACIIGLRLALMGKTPLDTIPTEVYRIFFSAMTSSWMFWIPIRFITISFLPPMYHLLSGSIFSFIWNVIFSLLLS